MSTAALIRSQIERFDAMNEEETVDALDNKSKPTDFGNVQFGARNDRTWSFIQIEDLAKSNLLYRKFRTNLTQFMEANGFKSPKDEARVRDIHFLIS
jgi:hypothetical protein